MNYIQNKFEAQCYYRDFQNSIKFTLNIIWRDYYFDQVAFKLGLHARMTDDEIDELHSK